MRPSIRIRIRELRSYVKFSLSRREMTPLESEGGNPDVRDTIGKLVRLGDEGPHEHLGTCFALIQPSFFVTATHCVGDLGPR